MFDFFQQQKSNQISLLILNAVCSEAVNTNLILKVIIIETNFLTVFNLSVGLMIYLCPILIQTQLIYHYSGIMGYTKLI